MFGNVCILYIYKKLSLYIHRKKSEGYIRNYSSCLYLGSGFGFILFEFIMSMY